MTAAMATAEIAPEVGGNLPANTQMAALQALMADNPAKLTALLADGKALAAADKALETVSNDDRAPEGVYTAALAQARNTSQGVGGRR